MQHIVGGSVSEAVWWAYASPPTGNDIGCCRSPQLLAFSAGHAHTG